MSLTSKFCRTC